MLRFLITIALCAIFVVGCDPPASAQPAQPAEKRGSNYDPPPPVRPKPQPPAVAPETDPPLIPIQNLDWSNKGTWIKMALLVGAVLLARRAFRQMKEEDD